MGKGRAKGKKQQRKNAAPASGGAFSVGQRVKVVAMGSFARGCGGEVTLIDMAAARPISVRLDGKQVSHPFSVADLAAA